MPDPIENPRTLDRNQCFSFVCTKNEEVSTMKWCLLLLIALVSAAMLAGVGAQPQRGRAISGFNRANDADYEDEEEDRGPPRKYGRRGYRSNCRCARISNCPKLQITIPRCPPEEFVCCFN